MELLKAFQSLDGEGPLRHSSGQKSHSSTCSLTHLHTYTHTGYLKLSRNVCMTATVATASLSLIYISWEEEKSSHFSWITCYSQVYVQPARHPSTSLIKVLSALKSALLSVSSKWNLKLENHPSGQTMLPESFFKSKESVCLPVCLSLTQRESCSSGWFQTWLVCCRWPEDVHCWLTM